MRSRLLGSNLFLVYGILLTASIFLFPVPGQAATYSWDANGQTWTWDTSLSNWWDSSSDIPWPTATDSVADFGAGVPIGSGGRGTISGGTVTVSTVQANGITFDITGYTLSGGTITLVGTTPTITVTTLGNTATIGSSIAGTVGFTKAGNGTLTLSGANTGLSGAVTLNAGTLIIGSTSALGTATGAFVINGGTIDANAAITTTNKTQNWNGDFTFTGSNNLNLGTGAVTLGGSGTVRTVTVTANTLTVGALAGGDIMSAVGTNGNYGLTKAGAGTLTLNNGGSIGGILNITAGKVQMFQDFTVGGLTGTGTIENGSGTTKWFFVRNVADDTFSGVIQGGALAGTLGLSKSGPGKLTLLGTNAYTDRTTITGGTVEYGNGTVPCITQTLGTLWFDNRGDGTVQSTYGNDAGNSSLTFTTLTRNTGATGNFVVSGGTNGTTNKIVITGQAAGFIGNNTFFDGNNYAWMNAAGTYVRGIDYTSGAPDAGTENIVASTPNFTAGRLYELISGSGQITAQGTQTITNMNITNNLPFVITDTKILTVNGILLSGGNTTTISGGATSGGIQAASGAELVIRTDTASDNLTISAPILNNGTNALTKTGAGTLTLSGNNTINGTITLCNGNMILSGNNTLGGALYVDAGVLSIPSGTTTTATNGTPIITVGNQTGLNAVMNISGGTLNANKNSNPSIRTSNAAASASAINLSSGILYSNDQTQIGTGTGAYGVLNQTGGTATSNWYFVVGFNNDRSVYNQSAGKFTVNNTFLTIAAGGSGSIGVSNLSGGTFNSPSGGILVGERGNGTLNVSGTAVVTVAGNGITMGDVDSGGQTGWNGTVNLLGGTIVTNKVAKGNISTGGTGVATFNFNGGTLQASTPNATFMTGLDNAYVNGAFGVYSGGGTIDNGGFAITIGQSLIAPTGNGVRATGLTVSGGGYIGTPLVVITNAASDTTGTGAKAVATLKPDGTTLDKIIITNPGVGYTAAPTFALVGGGNGNTGAIGGAATLVDNTLSSGGLTFTGTGTTTLSSANTYTGATLVNAGTLFLGPSGSINSSSGITINGSGAKLLLNTSAAITPTVNVTNGTFGGIGTVNNVVVDVGGNGIITASDVSFNALSIGSLTFNGAGAISLTIDQSTAYQALNVTTLTTGAVNTSGKVSLNASTTGSSWAPATYNLIYYSSLGGVGYGAFQPGTVTGLSNRQSATFSNDSNYIKMKIAGDVPKWTGLVNGNWTVNAITPVGGNTNWVLMTAGTATDFITGDVVTFDDSAPTAGGTTNVIISDANVGPASVAFNNSSSYTYTISSASETTYGIVDYVKSGITYPTSLLVEGGGAVSLNSTNTYSGGTTVSGGTLNINNASAIGTGTLTLDNISTYYSVTLDNTSSTDVTLTTDNPQIWNCNFAFTGTRNLNLGAGAVTMSATRTITVNAGTLTVGGAIGGSGFGLTKAGTGALTLGGANTYTGATIVSAGTLNVTGTVSGTQLDQVGNTSSSDAKLVISSGGSFTANLPGSAWSSSIDVGATGSAAGSVQMSGSTSSFTVNQQIALGNAGYGAFTQSAGTTTIGGFIACGGNNSSGGILNQSGGTITLTGAPITVGYVGTTGLGVMNLSGSAVFNANGPAGNGVWIGELGTAVLNVSGSAALNINSAGTLTGGGGLVLGRTNTTLSNGTVNLLGGTITTPFVTKGTGTGTLNFNGGTLKASADNATFLTGLTNAYVYNSGATIDDGGYAITIGQALLTPTGSNGVSASGLTVSGSGFIDTPLVSITGGGGGSGATAIATINYTTGALSGITITSPGTGYTTAPTFTLLGGGVGSSYSTTSGALSIVANAGGGLTKLGTGTVTITGANTYSGATAVNDGTLILSGAGSINGSSGITINGSTTKLLQTSSVAVTPTVTVDGTLDGTGIVNTVIVASGAGNIIANGNGGPGALTIGSLTFNGVGKISLNTAGSVALITTSLTTGASASSITVNVSNASWTSGTVYDLISYNNLLGTAGFSAFTKGIVTGLTPRQGSNLVPDGNNIALSITATSGSPVWTGAQNSKWRATPPPIGGLGNWQISLVPDEFITGDSVLFDNTAPGFTTVDISDANVAPTSTTFNNTTLSYIISSSGGYGISSGYLAKNGTGTVTITTSNTYAGVTIVNAGTLNINNASAIGTGVLTLTGGTIDASAGYIALTTNNAQSWNGDFTFKGTNNLNLGTGDVTLGGTAGSRTVTVTAGDLAVGSIPVATAGYGLTKAGAGTLSLTGASTNNIAGTLNITGGTVEIASDLYVTGLTGSGTIQAYTSASKWLYITNATDDTFAGVIQDGAGLLGLRKLGAGKLTLNGSINYSMETSVGGGTLVFSGTTNNTTAVDTIGDTAGANGVLIISSGANFSANDPVGQFTSSLAVGTNATSAGSVKLLAGGTLTTASQFGLGTGTGGYAAYTQTGGTANVGSYFVLGFNNDRSVANISGGSLNIGSNVITVGAGGTGSIGVLNLSGTVTVTSTATTGYGPTIGGIFVGENGAGTLNVSGNASLTLTGWGLRIGHNSGASGTVNLRGGTVTTTAVSRGSGTGALNFNGGTLKASGDTTTFLTGLTNTYVYSNGAIIDDGGKAITIGQVLLAPTGNGVSATGLTVSGSGFIDTPLVTITNASGDSTGAGATAIATINSDGSLAGITITNPGLGYTAAPTFALVGGGVGNTGAITGTATLVANTSGGLTKLGAGTMTLTASSTYTGNTTISDGTLALVSGGDISASSAISTGGSGTFEVDSGDHTVGTISGTGTTKVLSGSLTATSIVQDTLDIGSGSWATLNTATIDGGSTSGSLSEVPEPATWAMLMLAALGLGIYWRRRR